MSVNDRIVLDTLIEARRQEIAPTTAANNFFELYAAEQILKNYDPSYEEIEAGNVDGANDGGFDGIYTYLDVTLLDETTDGARCRDGASISLHVIQTKSRESFSGRAVDNFVVNLPLLLDFSRPLPTLADSFNEDVRRAIGNFRRVYGDAAQHFPQLRILCHYATRSPDVPHPNVAPKGRQVEEHLRRLFPDAEITFEFLGARELLALSRAQVTAAHELRITHDMSSAAGGYVTLVRLSDYFGFITEQRELRNDLFEANVRDYQGDVGVNRKIKETLEKPEQEDFCGSTTVSRSWQGGRQWPTKS